MKNYQQTPKQRRLERRVQVERAKRNVAHSKPHFTPREAWSPKLKIQGVPVEVLNEKQHKPSWF